MNQMISAFHAMTLVVVAWSFLFLSFVGIGLCVRRHFDLMTKAFDDCLTSFWLGWACVIILLQVWHLFLPVDWRVLLLVLGVGIGGLWWNRKQVSKFIGGWNRRRIWFWGILLLVLLWLGNQALGPTTDYDTGLYELGAVRWAASYPIVPGLGNLHGRLAFNSSFHLYAAMLDIGPFSHRSYHIATGLLFVVILVRMILSAQGLLKDATGLQLYHCLNIVLFIPILNRIAWGKVTSISSDLVIFLVGVLLTSEVFKFLLSQEIRGAERSFQGFYVILVAVAGITIKLSFVMFGLAVSAMTSMKLFMKTKGGEHFLSKRALSCAAACMFVALTTWAIRSVILSGYLVYPSPLFPFPVEWRLPRSDVVSEANAITNWARMPGVHWTDVPQEWGWLKDWASRIWRYPDVGPPVFLALVAFVCLILRRLLRRRQGEYRISVFPIVVPLFASLAFWFFAAPAPEFAGVFFWALASVSVCMVVDSFYAKGRREALKLILFLFFVLPIFLHVFSGEHHLFKTVFKGGNWSEALRQVSLNKELLVAPGKEGGFHPISKPSVGLYVTKSGLGLWVPENNQCWDSPLPCTPFPDSNLRLRVEQNLGSGFLKDGERRLTETTG